VPAKLKVKPQRMKAKLERLGEIATLHPDRKVREGLRDVIQNVHNKHLGR
jgi:uncharacterized lipoprotein YajG